MSWRKVPEGHVGFCRGADTGHKVSILLESGLYDVPQVVGLYESYDAVIMVSGPVVAV